MPESEIIVVKYLAIVLVLVTAIFYMSYGSNAIARDLFIKQSADDPDKNTKDSKSKSDNELFMRSGKAAPSYKEPGLNKITKSMDNFKIPASWNNVDPLSRDINIELTKSVIKNQNIMMAAIEKDNAIADAKSKSVDAEIEKKQREMDKAGAKNSKGNTKQGNNMKAKKGVPNQNATVIKRSKDKTLGKPKKLFNSPYE